MNVLRPTAQCALTFNTATAYPYLVIYTLLVYKNKFLQLQFKKTYIEKNSSFNIALSTKLLLKKDCYFI